MSFLCLVLVATVSIRMSLCSSVGSHGLSSEFGERKASARGLPCRRGPSAWVHSGLVLPGRWPGGRGTEGSALNEACEFSLKIRADGGGDAAVRRGAPQHSHTEPCVQAVDH